MKTGKSKSLSSDLTHNLSSPDTEQVPKPDSEQLLPPRVEKPQEDVSDDHAVSQLVREDLATEPVQGHLGDEANLQNQTKGALQIQVASSRVDGTATEGLVSDLQASHPDPRIQLAEFFKERYFRLRRSDRK